MKLVVSKAAEAAPLGSPDRQVGEYRAIKNGRPEGPTQRHRRATYLVSPFYAGPSGLAAFYDPASPDLTVGAIDCRRYAAWKNCVQTKLPIQLSRL